MTVNAIPEGYHSITPCLVVDGAAELIDFLKEAFDAREIFRMPKPDGRVMHAEVMIGDSMVKSKVKAGKTGQLVAPFTPGELGKAPAFHWKILRHHGTIDTVKVRRCRRSSPSRI